MSVASFAPSLQTATAVAFTFDYSLFLFSKVKSGVQAGKSGYDVIKGMLNTSGHVVIVSGMCLAVVLLLLVIFPV